MRLHLFVGLLATVLCGCPVPQPLTPPADASDASPVPPKPALDAAPVTPCQAACTALAAAGCAIGASPDCVTTLAAVESHRLIRTSCSTAKCPPLTCVALSTVKTALDAVALGVGCGTP